MAFCHTSTRISHRYTHVPSLLNLPPISLPIPPFSLSQSPCLSSLSNLANQNFKKIFWLPLTSEFNLGTNELNKARYLTSETYCFCPLPSSLSSIPQIIQLSFPHCIQSAMDKPCPWKNHLRDHVSLLPGKYETWIFQTG